MLTNWLIGLGFTRDSWLWLWSRLSAGAAIIATGLIDLKPYVGQDGEKWITVLAVLVLWLAGKYDSSPLPGKHHNDLRTDLHDRSNLPMWLLLPFLFVAPAMVSADPAYCMADGKVDYQLYFQHLAGAKPGDFAGNWIEKLKEVGLPPGPAAGVMPGQGFYGMSQLIGAGNSYRGVVQAPTTHPDPLGYRAHEYQVVTDMPGDPPGTCGSNPGRCVWTWIDRGGPPVERRVCGAVTPPPGEPAPGPVTPVFGLAELRLIVENMETENQKRHTELLGAVNQPGWFKSFITNRYVQMLMSGAGAIVLERLFN